MVTAVRENKEITWNSSQFIQIEENEAAYRMRQHDTKDKQMEGPASESEIIHPRRYPKRNSGRRPKKTKNKTTLHNLR